MRLPLLLVTLLLLAPLAPAADKEQDREARKKEAAKRFEKLGDYCKERRVTHLVELLAAWGEFADVDEHDAGWAWPWPSPRTGWRQRR